jgi:hypothetical protein
MNCRQIGTYLNDERATSWTGKRFYPELVFGVIRKAGLKADLMEVFEADARCELVGFHTKAVKY